MKIQDRIKDFRRVRASALIPNPKNWRTHPTLQQDAMRGALAEVGYVDALIARETEKGLELIDGHLRAEITPDQEVPVLVLDVSEKEVEFILATFDPLSYLADADGELLRELVAGIETESEAIKEMLAEIDGMVPDFTPSNKGEQGRLDTIEKKRCPECGHEF